DDRLQHLLAPHLEGSQGTRLVQPHEPAVADDISGQDCSKPALDTSFGHVPPSAFLGRIATNCSCATSRRLSRGMFSGLPRSDKVRIVVGSPARKIVMDDVPGYLAFDARVSFVRRPFLGVIEGADHDAVPLRRADAERAAAVGAEAALQP